MKGILNDDNKSSTSYFINTKFECMTIPFEKKLDMKKAQFHLFFLEKTKIRYITL